LCLKIGPVTIAIEAEVPLEDVSFGRYGLFAVPLSEPPTLTVRFRKGKPPARPDDSPVGAYATQWALYRQGEYLRLELLEQIGFQPHLVVLLDAAWHQADVFFLPSRYQPDHDRDIWPLHAVLETFLEWYLTVLLARQEKGLIVHASAANLGGLGVVFVGPSGSGKTTIVRWCQKEAGAVVLNDERVIVWHDEDGWKVAATPWHGELEDVSAVAVPADHLFFLRKGESNRFRPLPVEGMTTNLLTELYHPLWDKGGMIGLLAVVASFFREVPSGELEFQNTPEIASTITGIIRQPSAQIACEGAWVA
jgi:hypothetical protein